MSHQKTTCECGLDYEIGNPENEKWHHQIHTEYLIGPDIPEIQALPEIASKGDLRLVLVDKCVGEPIRKSIAHVAMVAHRCMPDYTAGYYGTDSEDSRLYALVNGTRIIGMAISSIDERFWRVSCVSNSEFQTNDKSSISQTGPKISRVWIAASYRRHGLAKWLIVEVSKHLGCLVQDIGWEMPLTNFGWMLVRSLCPEEFLGCGDIWTLRNCKFS